MGALIRKIKYIIDRLMFILKEFAIPAFIALGIFCIVAQWFGFDLQSVKLIQILGFDGNEQELTQLLVLYVGIWVLYNLAVKHPFKKDDSREGYREYLLKELGADVLGESSEDKPGDKESKGDDREDKDSDSIKIKNDKKDIIALMLKNNDEITDYFKISKTQAKSSFWFSVISCIVGLMALVVGIYGIVILKDVSVSVISLISGSISELISGTVFWVHNKSALQLNHYYDALHENEKFLSAVNIADKLSAEKREEVLVEIIHKQINSESSKTKIENIKEEEKKKEKDKNG